MQTDVKHMKKLVTAALCLALCLVLPFLTANNMALGNMLSLMHIPVLLCGLVCSWHYGLLVGFMAPLLRSFLLCSIILFTHIRLHSFILPVNMNWKHWS